MPSCASRPRMGLILAIMMAAAAAGCGGGNGSDDAASEADVDVDGTDGDIVEEDDISPDGDWAYVISGYNHACAVAPDGSLA